MSEEELVQNQKIKKSAKNHMTNIFVIFASVILVLAVIFAIFIKLSGDSDKIFIFGHKPYIVMTDSMEDEYKKHAFVIIKDEQIEDVNTGDVVAYQSFDELGISRPIFHRVVSQDESGLITKGDNLPNIDNWRVTNDSLVGVRVWHTNLSADIVEFFSVPRNLAFFVAAVAVVFFGLLVLVLRSRVKKRQTD